MHAARVAGDAEAWFETADDLVDFLLRTEVIPQAATAAAQALAQVEVELAGAEPGSRKAEIHDGVRDWLDSWQQTQQAGG